MLGAMTGRPRSVSDDEIFRSVTNVVARLGPARLTVAAVAAEAKLSAPSLLQRFETKQGLLAAYAENETGSIAREFRVARERSTPRQALLNALARLTRGVSTRAALANNLAFLHLATTDPDLRRHAVAQHRSLQREIASVLEDAIAQGELTSVNVDVLSDAVRSAYLGALTTWSIDGRGTLNSWIAERVDHVISPYLVG
jgi:AcrR family transcriptional regulator